MKGITVSKLTEKQINRKIAKLIKKWKTAEENYTEYDDTECLIDIAEILTENGYDTGDDPDSWLTW